MKLKIDYYQIFLISYFAHLYFVYSDSTNAHVATTMKTSVGNFFVAMHSLQALSDKFEN